MIIFVKTRVGLIFEIEALSTDTIANIKAKFQAMEGVLVSEQHIFFGGKQLEDDKTLEEYGIDNESTLILRLNESIKIYV